jgi:hypothetical protein
MRCVGVEVKCNQCAGKAAVRHTEGRACHCETPVITMRGKWHTWQYVILRLIRLLFKAVVAQHISFALVQTTVGCQVPQF